jgi:hypothetical protein
MGLIVKNNAASIIPAEIGVGDTSVTVYTGTGSVFPALGAGDYFYATISSVTNAYEIVKVTARAGDVLTIVRAQEGTTALSFPAACRIQIRVTVQNVADLIPDNFLLL